MKLRPGHVLPTTGEWCEICPALASYFEITVYLCRPSKNPMTGKHVIHKTRSTQYIATPPKEDGAMTTDNRHWKCGAVGTYSLIDTRVERQADRQTWSS